MKKISKLNIVIIVLAVFLILPQPALAKRSGINASSPFYFLDTLADDINVFISLSPESKARKQAKIKEERKAELKALKALEKIQKREGRTKRQQEAAEERLRKQQERTQRQQERAEKRLADQIEKIEDEEKKEELLEEIEVIEQEGEQDREDEKREREEESQDIEEETLVEEFIPEDVIDQDIDNVEVVEDEDIIRKDPFEDFPRATNIDPAISNITYSNFEFSQTKETNQTFRIGGVFIKGDKDLVVKFNYTEELPSLKAVGISLRYPGDNNKIFSFLLKPKPEKSYYIARTTSLGTSGTYPVTIYLLNHQNEIMKTISGELVVAGNISFKSIGSEMLAKVFQNVSDTFGSLLGKF